MDNFYIVLFFMIITSLRLRSQDCPLSRPLILASLPSCHHRETQDKSRDLNTALQTDFVLDSEGLRRPRLPWSGYSQVSPPSAMCSGALNSLRADVIEATLKEVWPRIYEATRWWECMLKQDLCLVSSPSSRLELFVPPLPGLSRGELSRRGTFSTKQGPVSVDKSKVSILHQQHCLRVIWAASGAL